MSPMHPGASRFISLACVLACSGSAGRPSPDAAPAIPDAADLTKVDLKVADRDLGTTKVDLEGGETSAPAACGAPLAGNAWAGWRMVEPAMRKFEADAEVVSDSDSGLVWQREVLAEQLAWDEAVSYCACLQLGGHDDWRLPTRMELLTIVDYRRQEPSIDEAVFPDTPNSWFWTSSLVAGEPLVAWYLNFMDGNTHEGAHDRTYAVRCVRGKVLARLPYRVESGVVTDPNTGLVWQQAVDGQPRTWEEARDYCRALALAGGAWRLPTMAELQSLIDEQVKEPAIDRVSFPATPSDGFWAGTPLAGMPPYQWFVSFDRGIAYNAVPHHQYHVRCVR